jgi:hypothetical protein
MLRTDCPPCATDCDKAANLGNTRVAALAKEAFDEKTLSCLAFLANSFASFCPNCCGEELLIVLQLNKYFCWVDFIFRVLGFTAPFLTRLPDFAPCVQALIVDRRDTICFTTPCKAQIPTPPKPAKESQKLHLKSIRQNKVTLRQAGIDAE